MLQYLGLPEETCFQTEEILQASGRKLKELDGLLQNLRQEEGRLKKEHRQLTEGRTLELPEALESELAELGVPVVYGMEWLRKNGCAEEQNRRLVHSHPFLPYALMLSRKELDRLRKQKGKIFTSFPVPIVVREELEEGTARESGGVLNLSGVHFYLLFNENLLNEEKLRLLVEEKEQEIRKIQEAVGRRKREYDESYERQEKVRNQSVSRERYEENERRLQELSRELEETKETIRMSREEQGALEQEQKALEQKLRDSEKALERLRRRQEDLEQLCRDYEQYGQNRQELEWCGRAIKRLEERKALAQASLEQFGEEQKSLELEAGRLEDSGRKLKEKRQIYETYAQCGEGREPESPEEAELLEARYLAITSRLSLELRSMEEQESRVAKRYETAAEDLEHTRLRYRLEPEAWQAQSSALAEL